MQHYFIDKSHKPEDFFKYKTTFLDKTFTFNSCDSVFSKNEADFGSLTLIKAVLNNFDDFDGEILDMCCGIGVIGLILADNLKSSKFDLCDINSTAVELAKKNSIENNIQNINQVFVSNMFENVKKQYDIVVSNPPIKTGKKILFDFAEQSINHIKPNGSLIVVIKKNLGEESLKKKLTEIYGNCEVIKRDKGYYILLSKKSN